MSSRVDLFTRPGEGAIVTLWRIGVTNADSVVTLTIDPDIVGATATAYTDGSGDDQGRIDIEIPTDAAAGTHSWTAEIDSVVVWTGWVYIEPHGRSVSTLAASPDIRTESDPPWVIYRAEDVELSADVGGPATQIQETNGPDVLDINAIADGEYLQRVGDEIVGATPSGSGDVTAASNFGTDNRLIRSDGTTKGVQTSGVTLSDANAMSGLSKVTTTDLEATGTITGISADDVGADASGTASAAVTTHEGKADPHTVYQLEAAKGQASGYASLNGGAHVVEPALSVTDGTDTFTFGALVDTQVLYLDGTTIKSKAGGGGVTNFTDLGDVPSAYTGEGGKVVKVKIDETGLEFVAGGAGVSAFTDLDDVPATYTGEAGKYPIVNATEDGLEFTDITAADVGADPAGTAAAAVSTHVGLADPHTQYQKESERGAASGYASLDSNTRLIEAAQVLRVTGQDLAAGAVSDGQFFVRSGTTYAGQTHDSTGDPHTQYQQESEKGSANGYAGLDASAFVAQAAPIIRATGVSLTVGAVNDGQMLVRSGSTIVGATAATATRQVVVLGSDFSTSGSGASVTGWSGIFTITAGKTYRIEMGGAHQAASNSVSIAQFAIDWSQTPQLVQTFWTPAHTGGSTAYSEVSVNADNTYANSGAVVSGGANTNFWVGMIGVFKAHASTGGTITVNMRSNDGTTQVTLKAGAFILIDQLD